MPDTFNPTPLNRRGFLSAIAFTTATAVMTSVAPPLLAQQPAQQATHHPAIKIPADLRIVKAGTNEEIPNVFTPGTAVELPLNSVNIRTVQRRWTGQDQKSILGTATFIKPDKNGVFLIPPDAVFLIGGDASQRKKFNGIAFAVPQGTDLIQVLPTIDFTPAQRSGTLRCLDADLMYEGDNRTKQAATAATTKNDLIVTKTPAFILNGYHPSEDTRGMNEVQLRNAEAGRNDRRPPTTSNDFQAFNGWMTHMNTIHNVSGEAVQMGIFEAVDIVYKRYELKAQQSPSPNP